jgi:hypothetical protein
MAIKPAIARSHIQMSASMNRAFKLYAICGVPASLYVYVIANPIVEWAQFWALYVALIISGVVCVAKLNAGSDYRWTWVAIYVAFMIPLLFASTMFVLLIIEGGSR